MTTAIPTTSSGRSSRPRTRSSGFNEPGDLRASSTRREPSRTSPSGSQLYQQANKMIMKYLPGVPYAHASPALGFEKTRQGLVAEPGRRSSVRSPSRYGGQSGRLSSSRRTTEQCFGSSSAGCCCSSRSCSGSRSSIFFWIRALPGSPAIGAARRARDARSSSSSTRSGTGSTSRSAGSVLGAT